MILVIDVSHMMYRTKGELKYGSLWSVIRHVLRDVDDAKDKVCQICGARDRRTEEVTMATAELVSEKAQLQGGRSLDASRGLLPVRLTRTSVD